MFFVLVLERSLINDYSTFSAIDLLTHETNSAYDTTLLCTTWYVKFGLMRMCILFDVPLIISCMYYDMYNHKCRVCDPHICSSKWVTRSASAVLYGASSMFFNGTLIFFLFALFYGAVIIRVVDVFSGWQQFERSLIIVSLWRGRLCKWCIFWIIIHVSERNIIKYLKAATIYGSLSYCSTFQGQSSAINWLIHSDSFIED